MKTKTKSILAAICYGGLAVAFIGIVMHISWTSGYMSRTLEETQEDLTSISESLNGILETTNSMIGVNDEMIQSTEEMIETMDGILEDTDLIKKAKEESTTKESK